MLIVRMKSLLFIFVLVTVTVVQSETSIVAKAISEIFIKFYGQNDHRFDILCFNCQTHDSKDLVSEVNQRVSGQTRPFSVINVNNLATWHYQLNISTLLVFDRFEDYCNFKGKVEWKTKYNSNQVYHLVYILEPTLSLKAPKNSKFINIDFIVVVNRSTIELATFIYYSEENCDDPQLKTINIFSKTKRKWINEDFFEKKFSNMHGCRLNFGYMADPGKFYLNKRGNMEGTIFKIHETIAIKLNIAASYLQYEDYEDRTKTNDEGNDAEIEEMLLSQFKISYLGDFVQLDTIEFDYDGFFIPPGRPKTQLQKMFLMFDLDVWMWLGITLGVGLLLIQLINFCSIKIQDIVFGERVETPTMNFFAVICGLGQPVLPKKNFSRFILILFIIFCLMFRTCHQSMLYRLLQADIREPELKTIDEAIDKGYTFYMNQGDMLALDNSEFISR